MNEENGRTGSFFAGFLMGGLAGATMALLTASRSGEETRGRIRAKGVELRDTAEQTIEEAVATVKTAALDMSNRAEELRTQSQAVLDETQKQWTEASADIKKVAQEAIEEMRTTAAQAIDETEKAATETK